LNSNLAAYFVRRPVLSKRWRHQLPSVPKLHLCRVSRFGVEVVGFDVLKESSLP
jgi:hypothetical protein